MAVLGIDGVWKRGFDSRMMELLFAIFNFLGWVFMGYIWAAFVLAFYEHRRRSNLESLTDEEKKANRFSGGLVCFCSGICLAAIHLLLKDHRH